MRTLVSMLIAGLSLVGCGGGATQPAEAPEAPVALDDDHGASDGDSPDAEPAGADSEAPLGDEDVQKILQLVIDDEELNRYLHLDKPGRFPFKMSGSALPGGVELTKGNEPVEVVSEPGQDAAVLIVTSLAAEGDSVTVKFRYPAEGVSGSAIVDKGEYGWEIKRTRVIER